MLKLNVMFRPPGRDRVRRQNHAGAHERSQPRFSRVAVGASGRRSRRPIPGIDRQVDGAVHRARSIGTSSVAPEASETSGRGRRPRQESLAVRTRFKVGVMFPWGDLVGDRGAARMVPGVAVLITPRVTPGECCSAVIPVGHLARCQ